MLFKWLIVFSIIAFCQCDETETQPEQVHLSLGADPTQMIVTWVTFNPTAESVCEYSVSDNEFELRSEGAVTKFIDGGSEQRAIYNHRAILTGLIPGQKYYYHCGSGSDGWSSIFWFTATRDGTDWSPRIALYGDLGNENGRSIPRLQRDVSLGMYDAIIHNGDIAYNMDSDNARYGDQFMRQIEPIAAYVPYQTSVGNHEQAYNFSNYVNRFTMVNSGSGEMNNLFYSFNLGPVHFVAFSSEFYFFVEYGWTQIATQYAWLEKDLAEANLPENRALRPWIITFAHRPMYCSTDDVDDCTHKESIIRKGLPILHAYGLEDLFYKYGVDIFFGAHEHTYERMWPVYNRKVYNGSLEAPYTNPKAPVHLIVGSAGCDEGVDPFQKNPPEWSAVRISDYGYTRMTIHNASHVSLEEVSDEKDGQIMDSFTIIKDKHGPEAWL